MRFHEILRLALAGVGSNKFRSFLTLLGIIIGVGAVILMVSLGTGAREVVSGQFSSLETRQFFLTSNWELPYQQQGRLIKEDKKYIEESTIGGKDAIPFYRFYFNIKYQDKNMDNQVAGVLPESKEVTNLEIKYGRYIEESDLVNAERVAVVGIRFLKELIQLSDYSTLIGKFLYVDGHKLLITGILDESESTVGLSDMIILVPLTTAEKLWRWQTRNLSFYLVTYDEKTSEKDIINQVKYLLDRKYGTTGNGESRFLMQGVQEQINVMSSIVKAFTLVLGGIAAISLLVGGIGVMNIMLVTVKERTREIGVRLAIGATRTDIRKQFLAESVLLAVGGGITGIMIGFSLSMAANVIITRFFDWWKGGTPIWVIVTSFVVTVMIGIIFGYYPAFKASKLDPIEALRYE